ncbi:D-glycero-beta-D-manno-heptose 1-phosphate adenylyltransferase [Woodsholea maritima]|uniref:D-glycero-beta-D-manno-heptose 1-phosphate adenylyltransferase n=1 Tax=Woodsholea maritima TaxID=240237 RepID=UPI00037F8E89|nr:D-glycero-beta-D-manno-heptose 1-phosphate adenylyltransferase [Woodsholea maritima]
MKREDAAALIGLIRDKSIVCIGDVLLDEFVYGHVGRVSREAPVPILSEGGRRAMLGGAGNLARNIASLGGRPTLISVIGDDHAGAMVESLGTSEAQSQFVFVQEAGRFTPTKIRYVAQQQQMFCVDRNPRGDINPETAGNILDAVKVQIASADAVILSDYGRGLLSRDLCQAIITLAKQHGCPVCVDPRGADYTRYDGAYVIKPNAQELADEAGLPVDSDDSAIAALHAVKARLPETAALLVTRGGQGMSLLDPQGQIHHHRSKPRSVFDVSGAGDTALAALSLSVAAKVSLDRAMGFADLAAGVAVGKTGTATVSPEEILRDTAPGAESPDWRVMAWDDLADQVTSWRAEGLKVGFTNGCFDILHPGHLSVLRFAKASCDRLIVGLNSDASVKRLKGEERPINNQATRAQMLASLETVDRVVIFDEETPEDLIRTLNPHCLIKGADYVADDLPGAAFLKAQGGEVLLAPLEAGLSTTNIVAKIKGLT